MQEMSGLRHTRGRHDGNTTTQRVTRAASMRNNEASQMANDEGTTSPGRTSPHTSPRSDINPPERRGRKKRATTKLRMAPRGRKVALAPKGDR